MVPVEGPVALEDTLVKNAQPDAPVPARRNILNSVSFTDVSFQTRLTSVWFEASEAESAVGAEGAPTGVGVGLVGQV